MRSRFGDKDVRLQVVVDQALTHQQPACNRHERTHGTAESGALVVEVARDRGGDFHLSTIKLKNARLHELQRQHAFELGHQSRVDLYAHVMLSVCRTHVRTMTSQAFWHLLSTRPAAMNATLWSAVAKAGGTLIPLESIGIESRMEDATVTRLLAALRSAVVVFTSPTAVDVAADALDLAGALNRRVVIATGAGTQKSLMNRGVRQARAPARMDSEGLLEMPELTEVDGVEIGLVTGEGGRGMLQPELEARGAHVMRADIYARVAREISEEEWANVRRAEGPLILAVTSLDAFEHLMKQVPSDVGIEDWGRVFASARLSEIVSTEEAPSLPHEWKREAVLADSAMPEDLVRAALTLL